MMTIRVFVNGQGIDVSSGATALDAVRRWNTSAAQSVEDGARLITDSRGLPIDASTPLSAGAILRLVANRERAAGAAGAAAAEDDDSAE